MEETIQIREVKAVQTRSGNTRFVLVDEKGNECSTKSCGRSDVRARLGLTPVNSRRKLDDTVRLSFRGRSVK